MATEITREEANELIKERIATGNKGFVTCNVAGRWYDLRGLSEAEIEKTLHELTQQLHDSNKKEGGKEEGR